MKSRTVDVVIGDSIKVHARDGRVLAVLDVEWLTKLADSERCPHGFLDSDLCEECTAPSGGAGNG
jgi:hypothetical protein